MTKDEALNMAIDAIENLCEAFMLGADWRGVEVYDSTVDALKACKEALEQPKEPPYLYVSKGDNGKPELSFIDHQESIGKIKLEVDE